MKFNLIKLFVKLLNNLKVIIMNFEQNINYGPLKSKVTFYYILVFVNLFINTLISMIIFY